MPEPSPLASSLYDNQHAPPPGARKFKRFQSQRRRKLKAVQLTAGNLVLDCPVPHAVLEKGKFKEGSEFTHMRYTAVTCDPNDFRNKNYTLRPVVMGRETELFIVLTMYNEDEILFNRTFAAVMKNIAHLCSRNNSRTWGANAWEKVVVCIVSDGRNKINDRTLAVLGAIGVYQQGVMQRAVSNNDVTAHLFEYTVQTGIDANMNFLGPQQGMPPVQVLFCLKEKNAKKINSHRWFFNAFSQIINPKVCVLIDVGTKPTGTSIYHLWKCFANDERVAGACGEIAADLGKGCKYVFTNPLVAAQNFEYKISNILDKPLESVFGYISVLPGAFSAYRYTALQDNEGGKSGPLYEYFKGELMHSDGADSDIFSANMYLAEDRILCFELVAKRRCNYILRYVKKAKAVTDVPDNLSELISQRRRWLNGSFFAAIYAIAFWYRMIGTSHSLYRRLMLTIEFIYQTVNMIFSWFALANFYLAYYFLEQNLKAIWDSRKLPDSAQRISLNADPFHGGGYIVMEVFRELYILALILQFVLSLGNRPQGTKAIYRLSVALFTVIMIIITYVAMYSVVYTAVHTQYDDGVKSLLHQEKFRDIVISMAATYGVYTVASLAYFEPWHMFTSFIQYTLWMPSSINILMVYAFCNTHDVSWGTKGDTAVTTGMGHAKVEKKDGVDIAHVVVASDSDDANLDYDAFIDKLKQKEEKKKEPRDAQTKREDQNKIFRTAFVVAWMCSNAVLAMVISSEWFTDATTQKDTTGSHNVYLSFIFWSVAALSAFRFIGSMWYRVRFLFHD
ncbi:glycosyltransferase family 2 protein [Coemansia spiralis]|nr:glycosyltransferase family 2 protein [Coemansia spiralis]